MSKERQRIDAYLDASPIAAWLGCSVKEDERGFLYQHTYAEEHLGNPAIRAIHGGAVATFLEFVMQSECVGHAVDAQPESINIDIDYVSSPRDQAMFARGKIIKMGRRIVFAEAICWQQSEQTPVAVARARLSLPKSPSSA